MLGQQEYVSLSKAFSDNYRVYVEPWNDKSELHLITEVNCTFIALFTPDFIDLAFNYDCPRYVCDGILTTICREYPRQDRIFSDKLFILGPDGTFHFGNRLNTIHTSGKYFN